MRKETKRNLFIAATYGAVLLLGLLLGQNYAEENDQSGTTRLLPLGLGYSTGKVQRMLDLIADNYVDSVDVEELQHLAIEEIMGQLDPHSEYLYPQAAFKQQQVLEGSFEGIGIEYYNLSDTLITVGLIAGGPAQEAGMQVGDKLIAINGDKIAGVNITEKEIEDKIRGRRGTPIAIHIQRYGRDLPEPLNVFRNRVEVSSIDAAYIIDSATAYVKIKRFGARTAEDFGNALQNLKKAGAKRLIVDLRENGGGYFSAATALASQFFNEKELLVYTEGAHEQRTDYYSSADGIFGSGPLAVLIDEQSASASEIVAGAIQDLERGIVVGRRSFGKGLVQEQFGFGDGSALNLTVARYYTPSGRSIQKAYTKNRTLFRAGNTIKTNVEERTGPDAEAPGEYREADRIDSAQIAYDTGGISPDVWVARGSADTSVLYQKIRRAKLIEKYVYGQLVKSTPAYSIENYLNGYSLPDETFSDFLAYAHLQEMTYTDQEVQQIKPLICTDMEALLGRFYFGSEAFFKVRNRSDQMLTTALTMLEGE